MSVSDGESNRFLDEPIDLDSISDLTTIPESEEAQAILVESQPEEAQPIIIESQPEEAQESPARKRARTGISSWTDLKPVEFSPDILQTWSEEARKLEMQNDEDF